MGFRALRVLNEDRVAPGHGFGMQPHRDLEIVTWVLDGSLRHEDSLGTIEVLHRGDVQRLRAGTGVLHREFNASSTDPLHLLQLWFAPAKVRLRPAYHRRHVDRDDRTNRLQLIASRRGRDGSLDLQQDVELFSGLVCGPEPLRHQLDVQRHSWIHVMRGALVLNGVALSEGDGAELTDEAELEAETASTAEFLLCDLA
jgi:redox-sensitive bicupin YhaK (pirin superfamily)